jgi:general secretion pathway protein M
MRWSILQQRFLASGIGRWYLGRESNEQHVILALTILVTVSILWLAVWKPVSDWRDIEHNRYQNAQAELDWMTANEVRARAVARSASGAGDGERSLLPVITRSAEAQGIRVNRLQPESNGVVSVSIQGQQFNALMQWLHQLQENNGVSVLRLAVDSEGRPGMVNAQIRLQ